MLTQYQSQAYSPKKYQVYNPYIPLSFSLTTTTAAKWASTATEEGGEDVVRIAKAAAAASTAAFFDTVHAESVIGRPLLFI